MTTADTFILTVTRHLPAPPEAVFAAFLDPEAARHWLFATPEGRMERVEIDPRPGGHFRVDERRGEALARHFGTFIEIGRPHRLVFTFATEPDEPPSRVTVEIAPAAGGSRLTLTHELSADWRDWADKVEAGWEAMLGTLAGRMARTLMLTRHIPAPVARVWAAWTDPERLPLWWGPRGFTCRTKEIDLREGGLWRFDMVAPDGTVFPNRHRFTRMKPMEAIDYLLDDDGAGEHDFAAFVRFAPEGAGCRVTLTMLTGRPGDRAAMEGFGAVEHGYTTLDCLTEAALAAPAVAITRTLAAPRARVWAAWTDPAQLAEWFFPDDCTLSGPRFDIRAGGGFALTLVETATGQPFPMSATVERLDPGREIVFAHRWATGGASRITVTLEDAGAEATRLFFLQEGITTPGRDSQFEGWSQVVARLADHLADG